MSIQVDENGNKYVRIDDDLELFNNLNLEQIRKMAKMVIMDKYGGNGIAFGDKKININSRTAKEFTNPKVKLNKIKKEIKYRLSTELENLTVISKKIYTLPISDNIEHKRHKFASDGWEYYYTRFKYCNKEYIGKLNIGINGNERTLYDMTSIYRIDEYKKMTENGKLDKSSVALIQSFTNNSISLY